MAMKLDFLEPVATTGVKTKIIPDGKLDESDWSTGPQITLPNTETDVFLRHDTKNLYIAAKRRASVSRKGVSVQWAKTTTGEDAEVWKDDSFEIFLSDSSNQTVVHLGLSASGVRYDARAAGTDHEDKSWTMPWRGGVIADEKAITLELSIPLASLTGAGLDRKKLGVNVMMNKRDTRSDAYKWLGGEGRNWNLKTPSSEAMGHLGSDGRKRCAYFAPLGIGIVPERPSRTFTVRLYFSELDPIEPGTRVFDVKLQDRTILKSFDIVKEASGIRKAVVRDFRGVRAKETLTIEFAPSESKAANAAAPIINALEIFEETRK